MDPRRLKSTFYACYTQRMTTPIPTRFSDDELAMLDALVAEGVGATRSDVIRRGVHHLTELARRRRIGLEIVDSYRRIPQDAVDDELAMAMAIAMTEAEPW